MRNILKEDSKIYIAGHRGLVGSAIVRCLEKKGYTNLLLRTHSELDLTNKKAVYDFFETENPEYVILAAAKVGGIMANLKYRADFIYANLEIQNNVISASHKNNVKKLLFLGSSCIYPKEAPQPITEDALLTSPLEYTNEPYAIAKIAGIKMIESYNLQYGTNYLAVMPTNLYGPNDNFDLETSHVFPATIRKMLLAKWYEENNIEAIIKDLEAEESEVKAKLEEIGITKLDDEVIYTAWGTGAPRREFLHSDDMAEACIFVMNNINFDDVKGSSDEVRNTHLNVGTNSDISISEFINLVKELVGFKGSVVFDEANPDGTIRKLMSSEKLNILGWKPKILLEDGVKEVINSYTGKINAKH